MTGHDTDASGGDLATVRLSTADIESFVRVMPVHLSGSAIRAVATYIAATAGKPSPG